MTLRRSARVSTITLKDHPDNVSSIKPPNKKRPIDSPVGANQAKRSKATTSQNGQVDANNTSDFKVPAIPKTPESKRRVGASKSKVPPITPTPSFINVIRAPYSSGDVDDVPPPDRPADPHVTNAALVTPGGTQSTAYNGDLMDSSPSKTGLPRPTATTGNILDKACAHLIKVDSRMKPLVEKHTCHLFTAKGFAEEIDPFRSLSSGIMGQQVSGAAARSIKNKFIALFHEGDPETVSFPTPKQVVATDIARLRLAGLSQRKAEYIHGLAEKFVSGELSNAMLMKSTDEEVMEKLIAVRGLGKWSVEMFSCFGLKRLDILSTGDLGVQRGMAAFFGKDVKKLKAKGGGKWKYMSEEDMLSKSAPFAPYRSIFMWYMWRVEDVDVDVLQNSTL